MVILRPADESDSLTLWQWRNDEASRAASLDTHLVAWSDHERWFAASLQNPSRLILMAVDDALTSIGMVRFDFSNLDPASVSINVAPECRGRGLGQTILHLGLARARESRDGVKFIAQVRSGNEPSIRIFEREGFVRTAEDDGIVTLLG